MRDAVMAALHSGDEIQTQGGLADSEHERTDSRRVGLRVERFDCTATGSK
jgi:hypothetical protein